MNALLMLVLMAVASCIGCITAFFFVKPKDTGKVGVEELVKTDNQNTNKESNNTNAILKLKDITKNYKVAGGEIQVLKGLNVSFRKSEFVSILGPSGCGKTTTLNIVGGLDKYTSGDLVISGRSTKDFTDRDWDAYRNQRIGFIFQSYNLIPHQTVLGNVELALTISGVSKEERVARAKRALERVGLKGEEYKRPNQLSGGQCQRVAIARALVNEPDILLADEPTGALDSKTSVQIMELIKEISKDKLVIMVTHNGEIAEQYSTRIVRLIDGEIVEDTNPYNEQEEIIESTVENPETSKKVKDKVKMSRWTAFKLSARNLFSKRKRTLLTSIAGSIGIIGISAVLAVSSGVRGYIANMQDDMLSGNPITIQQQGYDLNAMMNGMDMGEKKEFIKEEGYVNIDSMMTFLAERFMDVENLMYTNEITQDYIDYIKAMPKEYAALKLDMGLDVSNNIYTSFSVNGSNASTKVISLSALKQVYTSVMEETKFKDNASLITSLGQVYMQAPSDKEYILSQYDLNEGGRIAEKANEIMIVANGDWALTDLLLAQLGYYNQEEFINIALKAAEDIDFNPDLPVREKISHEELMGKKFVWHDNDTVFTKTPATNPFASVNPFTYSAYEQEEWQGLEFEIVGVLTPKENLNYGCLQAGFYYTEAFANYAIEKNLESEIVKYLKDKGSDGFSTVVMDGVAVKDGISYKYSYTYNGIVHNNQTGYVGTVDAMSTLMSSFGGGATGGGAQTSELDMLTLTSRQLGGETVSNDIKIYPMDFEMKDLVVEYLDKWNNEGDIVVGGKTLTFEDRTEIKYTDSLSLIMSMIDSMIDIVTIALISFTSLALVVSCVMIAIITYVSVVERIKEIGVIRALGGRKKDVSNLFNAETLVIGLSSGLIGVGFTYLLSVIVNVIVKHYAGFAIMTLPFSSALIMIALSVGLTVLSGLIPARKAAHQDPVVALRTE